MRELSRSKGSDMDSCHSITGIVFLSQLAIAISQTAEKLMNYAEASAFAIVAMQIQTLFVGLDIILGADTLPASLRQAAKCGLFRRRLLLVY